MDFEQIIFKNKTFGKLLEEVYGRCDKREKQINDLIKDLQPMIKEPGDAMMLVPLLTEYLELGIKNDESLIKMAAIVQKAIQRGGQDDNKAEVGLTESERKDLFDRVKSINQN